MKNSLKNVAGIALILIATAGISIGQEKSSKSAEKAVQGIAIARPAAATIEGVAIAGQTTEPIKLARTASLKFNPETKTSEVKIKITEDYNYLMVDIYGDFKAGSITVELIDPKGEKRGHFNLKVEDIVITGNVESTKAAVAIGKMQKGFAHPIVGEWIVRAIPVNAEGGISISFSQEFRPEIGNTIYVDGVRVDPAAVEKQKK